MIQVSVLISTSNVAGSDRIPDVRACLEALQRQSYPARHFEVIVITHQGAAVRTIIDDLADNLQVRSLEDGTSTRARALNHGVHLARGKYCIFLDASYCADVDFVAEHVGAQTGHAEGLGLGRLRVAATVAAFSLYVEKVRSIGGREAIEDISFTQFLASDRGSLSVPRARFLEVGGFTEELGVGEEIDLAYRLQERGLPLFFVPKAVSFRSNAQIESDLVASIEREGMTAVEIYRRHPAMIGQMPLGRFHDLGARGMLIRSLLLALHVPAYWLFGLGNFFYSSWFLGEGWYRFLYTYSYWHGVQRGVPDTDTWRRLTRAPVVLMYHAIGRPGEQASQYVVPRERFRRQMAWLAWRGYHVLSLDDLLAHRLAHRLPPARSVVLTFDDGYQDNWSEAYPILKEYGFTATVFVVSDTVGARNRWDRAGELADRPMLTVEQMREMCQTGPIRIGAHTRSHASLTSLAPERVWDEITGSRANLERLVGHSVSTFSYPHGKQSVATRTVVEYAGFVGACCSESGPNDSAISRFALCRLEIRGTDSFLSFVATLELGMTRALWRLWRAQ